MLAGAVVLVLIVVLVVLAAVEALLVVLVALVDKYTKDQLAARPLTSSPLTPLTSDATA